MVAPQEGLEVPAMTAAPRRVLFITPQPFFEARGSPIRVSFDVRALAEMGYEVDLLCMPPGKEKAIPGVRIHRVANPLRIKHMPIGPSLLKVLYDGLVFFKAWSLCRRNAYLALHAVEEAAALAVLLPRRTRRRARVIFEKHSDPASYAQGLFRKIAMALYGRIEAFTIRRADAVICTGPGLVKQALAIRPTMPVHHIMDIPSSTAEADPRRTAALRERFDEGHAARRLVLYVGSFAVYQGIDLLFDAIPLVVRRNTNARFVIIGGRPEQIARRRRDLQKEGVADAVTFLGHVKPDDLPDMLAAADLLLSPRCAGTNTPLKLLDYLKSGRAIIACDHPANRLILNESNACLVKAEAPAFAEAILQALRDDALRGRLGAAGRELIDRTYNYREFKNRLAECYRGLDDS